MTAPLRDVWADTLIELADRDPRVLVLDADLATSTRADKFARAHPGSFYEMGIAEQGMVGTAVGLATMGFVPWLSSFAVFFSHRAVDQVRMAVAQTHANVKIGAAYAGVQTGFTGKTHLDIQDLTIMRAMPGMTVLAPGDAVECAAMVRWATATPGPVYLRLGREGGPDLVPVGYEFVPGRVLRLRAGSDVLLVSTGQQSARTLAAAGRLAADGIDAAVLHVPCLKPVDADAIASAAAGLTKVSRPSASIAQTPSPMLSVIEESRSRSRRRAPRPEPRVRPGAPRSWNAPGGCCRSRSANPWSTHPAKPWCG